MDVFSALAEPTRRDIIQMLANKGQLSATDICNRFRVSHPAISQHLRVLREAELVRVQKLAQQRIYRLNPDKMLELEKWAKNTAQIYEERFDELEMVLETEKKRMKIKKGNRHGKRGE